MSRFNLEDIRHVAMTYNPEHDAVEFCAIEAPRGVVHWMTEAEHDKVKANLKARAKGEFVLRESEEAKAIREERDRLKDLVAGMSKAIRA